MSVSCLFKILLFNIVFFQIQNSAPFHSTLVSQFLVPVSRLLQFHHSKVLLSTSRNSSDLLTSFHIVFRKAQELSLLFVSAVVKSSRTLKTRSVKVMNPVLKATSVQFFLQVADVSCIVCDKIIVSSQQLYQGWNSHRFNDGFSCMFMLVPRCHDCHCHGWARCCSGCKRQFRMWLHADTKPIAGFFLQDAGTENRASLTMLLLIFRSSVKLSRALYRFCFVSVLVCFVLVNSHYVAFRLDKIRDRVNIIGFALYCSAMTATFLLPCDAAQSTLERHDASQNVQRILQFSSAREVLPASPPARVSLLDADPTYSTSSKSPRNPCCCCCRGDGDGGGG